MSSTAATEIVELTTGVYARRAPFREHMRAAQVVLSIAGGAGLIALGALLLANGG